MLVRALQALDTSGPTALADAAALRLNLAAIQALARDWDRAEALLAPTVVSVGRWPDDGGGPSSPKLAVSHGLWTAVGPFPAAVTLLGVYILMGRGRLDRAAAVLAASRSQPGLFAP